MSKTPSDKNLPNSVKRTGDFRVLRHTEETLISGIYATKATAAVFHFRLPFNLSLPSGARYVLRRSLNDLEPPWVEMLVHRVRISLEDATLNPYSSGLAVVLGNKPSAKKADGSSGQTWISASTMSVLFEGEDGDLARQAGGFATITFERCLSAVNRLIAAEQLRIGNLWSHAIAKEALDREIAYFIVDLQTGKLGMERKLNLHTRPYNPTPAAEDPNLLAHVSETLNFLLASEGAPNAHPMIAAREMAASALASVYAGNPFQPVLLLQASTERYLRGVLRMLLIDQHLPEEQVHSQADEEPFAKLLTGSLQRILGGDWTSKQSPISIYKDDLYNVRNSLTHKGQMPSWQELNPAIAAHKGIVNFIEDQILKSWKRFPRTLLSISEPALGGTLKVPATAANKIEELRLEATPYWLADDVAKRTPIL